MIESCNAEHSPLDGNAGVNGRRPGSRRGGRAPNPGTSMNKTTLYLWRAGFLYVVAFFAAVIGLIFWVASL